MDSDVFVMGKLRNIKCHQEYEFWVLLEFYLFSWLLSEMFSFFFWNKHATHEVDESRWKQYDKTRPFRKLQTPQQQSNSLCPHSIKLWATKTAHILKCNKVTSSCYAITWNNKGLKNKFSGSKAWYLWVSKATLTKFISNCNTSKIKLLKLQIRK